VDGVGAEARRVSRELKALGWRVTATDAVAAMVDAAREANSADDYAIAPASRWVARKGASQHTARRIVSAESVIRRQSV
jgi:hypothetical protein